MKGTNLMKNLSLALLSAPAAIAMMVPASAANAAEIVLTGDDTQLTGKFSGVVKGAGEFTREFTFELPTDGITSTSITSIAVTMMTNLDFTSVLLNGTPFIMSANDTFEFGGLTLATLAGTQTLTVNGISGGNASFAGTISFASTAAVPEPGTWALLLVGFAAVGGAMRRRKPTIVSTGLAYA